MNEKELAEIVSGEFLTENYPSAATSWSNQRLAEYCEEFKCEDFEHFEGDQLRQMIGSMARTLIQARG